VTVMAGVPSELKSAVNSSPEAVTLVIDLVGEAESLRYGALLISSAHGIA